MLWLPAYAAAEANVAVEVEEVVVVVVVILDFIVAVHDFPISDRFEYRKSNINTNG